MTNQKVVFESHANLCNYVWSIMGILINTQAFVHIVKIHIITDMTDINFCQKLLSKTISLDMFVISASKDL